MIHYFTGLALLAPLALFATSWTGAFHDGSQTHLVLGLFTSIYCVAVHTLLIMFMIVTGRILRSAAESRPLGSEFLAELNVFFTRKSAYPLAIFSAFFAVATAVLGHGRYIGVPIEVHMLIAVAAVLLNLFAFGIEYRTLRDNQRLVDRVAAELDRIDAQTPPGAETTLDEPPWAFGRSGRWLVFATTAWGPYVYWGLVVWRGRFGEVSPLLLTACALASAVGFARAFGAREAA